jgi:inorganic triphosphatase YgiF
MSLESELKFRIAKRSLTALANARMPGSKSGERTSRKLVSTYFDTPKHKLQRHGMTLRVRRTDDGSIVQTVKSAMTRSFARGEWAADLDRPKPDISKAKDSPLAKIAGKKARRNLRPIFETSVKRITRSMKVGASSVELAVDLGHLSAGRRSEPITEFELELKSGHTADLFRLARNFERKTAAELDLRSKADRGYSLANGQFQRALHAEKIELESSLTAHKAFTMIALSTLRQFGGNADGVREGDAEAIHQMRVGLRRLRAAISLFGDILPRPRTERIKKELKWLTGELAPAREIDVFVKEKVEPLKNGTAPKRGAHAVNKEFSARRKRAFLVARKALELPRYRVLLLDVLEWLETRNKSRKPEAGAPIGAFAYDLLDRRVRKVGKQGKDLTELSPPDRHKLRIKIKKIRYAVDFFRGLYPKNAQDELDALSARLKKIQDALGALNDFVAHQKIATEAALEAPPEHRRARAFASGLLVGQEREAARTLFKSAETELRHLRPLKAKPS